MFALEFLGEHMLTLEPLGAKWVIKICEQIVCLLDGPFGSDVILKSCHFKKYSGMTPFNVTGVRCGTQFLHLWAP